jgi:hypothetical protein
VIAFSLEAFLPTEPFRNPWHGESLTIPQIIHILNRWSLAQPIAGEPLTLSDTYCHLLLWDVQECDERAFPFRDGCHIIEE